MKVNGGYVPLHHGHTKHQCKLVTHLMPSFHIKYGTVVRRCHFLLPEFESCLIVYYPASFLKHGSYLVTYCYSRHLRSAGVR
jgi:hypothetical protein